MASDHIRSRKPRGPTLGSNLALSELRPLQIIQRFPGQNEGQNGQAERACITLSGSYAMSEDSSTSVSLLVFKNHHYDDFELDSKPAGGDVVRVFAFRNRREAM
jgi:hypothetical protein